MKAEIRTSIRSWVTPITVIVFLLLAGTGLTMEGHTKGLNGLHQMLGYAFCAIAVAHIALNWRMLYAQLRTARGLMAVLVVGVLCSLIWLGAARGTQDTHSQVNRHGRSVHPASVPEAGQGSFEGRR